MSLPVLATLSFHFIFINFLLPFSHQLSFYISKFNQGESNILYDGDAMPSYLLGFEVIVPCRPGYLCRAFSHAANVTTNFTFIVHTVNRTLGEFADWFVFFLAPIHFPIPPNSAGADLGLYNSTTRFDSQNQLVTVEFDTYSNPWDPPGPYIGINNQTISSVSHASWDRILHSGKEGRVRITYNATNNRSVFWNYEGGRNRELNTYVPNSSLSILIDLRNALPEWVTIGFSSSTGLKSGLHDISSWEFSSDMDSGDIVRKKKKRTTLKIGVVVAVVMTLMLGVAIYSWAVLRKRIKRTRGDEKESNDSSSVALSSINSDLQILALPSVEI